MLEQVLEVLDQMKIKYDAIGGNHCDTFHAFVALVDEGYSLELVQHNDTVEVYAFQPKTINYGNDYVEVTYFSREYKTVNGAVKRALELINELNELME